MSIDKATNYVRNRVIHFDHIISQLDISDSCADVSGIFEELIWFCCLTQIPSVTFNSLLEADFVLKMSCENLNRLLSRYEYQLEINWARKFVASGRLIGLESFPDIDDYRRSTRLETDILWELGVRFARNPISSNECRAIVTKMVFIGSGPLPISSMIILSEYAPFIDIYNIDISEEANQLACVVSQRLLPAHLSVRMHFITYDVSQRPIPFEIDSILKGCQLIYVAALVGENEATKLDILRNIIVDSSDYTKVRTVQHVVIRTTDGLRQALYPKITAEKISMLQSDATNDQDNSRRNLLQIESSVHPQNNTRMSIIVAKKL